MSSSFLYIFKRVFFLLNIISISLSKQSTNKGLGIVGLFDLQKNPQEILSDGVFSKIWLKNSKNPISVSGLASTDSFLITGLNYDLEISNVYLNHDSTDDLGIRIALSKLSSKNFEIQIKSDATDVGEGVVNYELFLEIPTGEDVSFEWKKLYKIRDHHHDHLLLEL